MDIDDAVWAAAGLLPRRWVQAEPGRLLFALRRERRISQRHLADEAGLDHADVCRIESGADARLSTWKRLFRALGYDLTLVPASYAEETGDLLTEAKGARWRRQQDGLLWGRRRRR